MKPILLTSRRSLPLRFSMQMLFGKFIQKFQAVIPWDSMENSMQTCRAFISNILIEEMLTTITWIIFCRYFVFQEEPFIYTFLDSRINLIEIWNMQFFSVFRYMIVLRRICRTWSHLSCLSEQEIQATLYARITLARRECMLRKL